MIKLLSFSIVLFLLISQSKEQKIYRLSMRKFNSTDEQVIIDDTKLDKMFSDQVYNQKLCCKTELYILEFKNENETKMQGLIELIYNGTKPQKENITIKIEKQGTPQPYVQNIYNTTILLGNGCPENISDKNYWSKVDITIFQTIFSFRIHCDQGTRHKNFEWGYVIIMIINSTIMISVALYSRIWSIKLKNNRALGIPVRWIWLSILTLIVILFGGLLIYFDSKQKNGKLFGITLQIIGVIFALIFGVIILNQIFFLVQSFKKKVFKSIRICDILSVSVSALIVILFGIIPSLADNFILNDILSVIISVGAIKLFKFLNLKDAIICCSIVFVAQNIVAVFVHYFYHVMSYNDLFGSTVNSPLVTQISILSYSLYQKCSWLPVSQIILPGITIAYLRRYDHSRDSKLYLLIGNFLFVISTFLWILIQGLSVHSLPFSLITYPALFIPLIALAYKRDELKTLLNGKFYDPQFMDSSQQKQISNNSNDISHLGQSALQGLMPQSQDMQQSKKQSF